MAREKEFLPPTPQEHIAYLEAEVEHAQRGWRREHEAVERLEAELEGWKTYVDRVVELAVKGDLLKRPNPEPIYLDRKASRAFLRESEQRKLVDLGERKQVIAFLKRVERECFADGDSRYGAFVEELRRAIERGEHLAQEPAPEKEAPNDPKPWYHGMSFEEINAAISQGTAPGSRTPGAIVPVPHGFLTWRMDRLGLAGPQSTPPGAIILHEETAPEKEKE